MKSPVHPAVLHLVWMLTIAKVRRIRKGLAEPRRCILTIAGVCLAFFYASNIIVSAFVREPMAPGRFKTMIPLGLLAYVLWDLLKTACRRPEQALVWSRVERERLRMAPLSRRDILAYKLAGVAMSAIAKAVIFSMVMFADMPLLICGLFGSVLALVLIDVLRMMVSMTVYALPQNTFRTLRAATIGLAAVVAVKAIGMAWGGLGAGEEAALGSIKFVVAIGRAMVELGQTPFGQAIASPFRLFADVMATESFSWTAAGKGIACVFVVSVAVWALIRLDAFFQRQRNERECTTFLRKRHSLRLAKQESLHVDGNVVNLGVWTTLIWRQALGAKRFWSGVVVALVPPSIFSFLPMLVGSDRGSSFYAVVGSLAFYSFILLPSALKFDFRADYYRMTALKSLPLKPSTVVCGQLACPIVITSLFQCIVVTIAAILTGHSLVFAVGAMLVLVPMSVAIYGLDNLIFLLYPHPMKQEGIDAFTRTTLTFTGKGLVFGLALCVMVGWAIASSGLARAIAVGNPRLFFVSGLGVMLAALGALSVWANIRAYAKFDPCLDAVTD